MGVVGNLGCDERDNFREGNVPFSAEAEGDLFLRAFCCGLRLL